MREWLLFGEICPELGGEGAPGLGRFRSGPRHETHFDFWKHGGAPALNKASFRPKIMPARTFQGVHRKSVL